MFAQAEPQTRRRRAATATRAHELSPSLWKKIAGEQQRSPHRAHALARAAYEIARHQRDPALRARAELSLIQTFNTLGELPAVLASSESTGARFEKLGDAESAARVWLEAALAEMWRANLASARAYLERAESFGSGADVQFRAEWIRAWLAWHESRFQEAEERFTQLRLRLDPQDTLNAARLLRGIGVARERLNPQEAVPILEQARQQMRALHRPTEVAWSNYFLAQALIDVNRFREAEVALQQAATFATREHMRYLGAACDIDLGYLRWSQQRFQDALALTERARAIFVELGALQNAGSCDINIGGDLRELNRYAEAIPRLENAARIARETNHLTQAGVAHSNLGEVYDLMGDYPRALQHHLTARELFAPQHSVLRLSECDLALGKTYFHLGQPHRAARAYQRGRRLAAKGKLPSNVAQADLGLGQIALARGQRVRARARLRVARARFQMLGQNIYVAYCERLLAECHARNPAAAKHYLDSSQEHFARQNLFVQVALCELTRGELHCARQEWDVAEHAFHRAQKILEPAFPDHAWRIAYGLGKIARARGDHARALAEWLRGGEMIAALRGAIQVEAWSNDLFHTRRQIFSDTLALAHTLKRDDAALRVIEIAKAQTFLQQLRARAEQGAESLVKDAALLERERALRESILQQRKQLVFDVWQTSAATPLRTRAVQFKTLGKLQKTLHAYEHVAQQVRLAQRGLKGNPALAPFDLQEFRAYANARWGEAWTALEYFFANGDLYIACITPAHVSVTATPWNNFDRAQLKLATSTHPDERELVYDRTLRGMPIPAQSDVLAYLTLRLIPEAVYARGSDSAHTLILAPHGLLHQLPFHALQAENAPLLERFNVMYTPSLQALVELARNPIPQRKPARLLICGAETFDDLPPLPYARAEVNFLKRFSSATVLWQNDATRAAILDLNQRGALARCTHLHFATHARVEADAPHESHIALTDRPLNVLDISELNLNARLVTLSACASALGKGGSGDELLGLTRVFFSAGARAVVASLWNVGDASTAELMKLFYRNLDNGESVAAALRHAQLALYRRGLSAYHWAPFVAMGDT